jgi:hypothetical protein
MLTKRSWADLATTGGNSIGQTLPDWETLSPICRCNSWKPWIARPHPWWPPPPAGGRARAQPRPRAAPTSPKCQSASTADDRPL